MTKNTALALIVQKVTDLQGCKVSELIAALADDETSREVVINFDIPELIEFLVQNKMVVEVAYVLPNMGYRIKSFLLPTQCKAHIYGDYGGLDG